MKKKKTVKAKAKSKAKKTKPLESVEFKGKTIWKMPLSKCPWCDVELNGAYQHGAKKSEASAPNVGDFTVCVVCCEIIVFGEGHALLRPDYETYREASKDKGVMFARVAVLSGGIGHKP